MPANQQPEPTGAGPRAGSRATPPRPFLPSLASLSPPPGAPGQPLQSAAALHTKPAAAAHLAPTPHPTPAGRTALLPSNPLLAGAGKSAARPATSD